MNKYLDKKNGRLIFVNDGADEEYWDKFWQDKSIPDYRLSSKYFVDITKQYLPKGSKILEGGSGLGDKVKGLQESGYQVIGIDFAKETVKKSLEFFPDLDIREGDVRELEFKDSTFDGYWSLGVIEHFWDGYDDILSEAIRVIKPEGYLFLTFPSMSKIRKLKAYFGFYEEFNGSVKPRNFYQYALRDSGVIKNLEKNNFKVLKVKRRSVEKGIRDELMFVERSLNIGKRMLPTIAFKIIRKLVYSVFIPFVGHGTIIVAKNVK